MITPEHKQHDRIEQVVNKHLVRRGLPKYMDKLPPELILAVRDAVKELAGK